ncbi:DUF4199 domain-containing protein [Capnocytophaga sp. G2]|uniref:DUF4199 domain-containing protein n=1 Tax=Capnocytophaga sp. G2 TaxID=3110695 RepID=UPI002B4A4E14|nr:DUF4199 domain-containing protein [Capnocytophaga sp. G2]MEB3004825.1 DUF4199 domain-containing protein [Capnocytophaga sp. G2]
MKSSKQLMLIYGFLSGIISIGLVLLQYFTNSYNSSSLIKLFFGIFPVFMLSLFIFLGIYQSKERSFRQMLKIGLGISLLFSIITSIFWVIFIKYIHPDLLNTLNTIQLEVFITENPNATPEEITQLKESMEKGKSLWAQFNFSVVSNMLFGFIISLLRSSFSKIVQRQR